MYIHKEGYFIIGGFLLVSALVVGLFFFLQNRLGWSIVWPTSLLVALLVLNFFVLYFFRMPKMEFVSDEGALLCPADGKIVIVEEVDEPEYFQGKRKQVSVFMSPLNVHVNRYPCAGKVVFYRYHAGKYLVAWHPKSSTLNERTTVVVQRADGKEVLVRQIAGAVARRIVCYAQEGQEVQQNAELGFIKFGSRVDLFLPLDAEILVKPDDVVKGGRTIIARW